MSVLTQLRTRPDADLARLCRALVPLVMTRSWSQAQQLVALWDKIVASDQTWYWTPEWQAAEAKADAELAAGKFDDFASIEEMISDLESSTTKK